MVDVTHTRYMYTNVFNDAPTYHHYTANTTQNETNGRVLTSLFTAFLSRVSVRIVYKLRSIFIYQFI